MTCQARSLIPASASYYTRLGAAYVADSLTVLAEMPDESINLVITSPPFALQREKEYGNLDQLAYLEWISEFGRLVHRKLKPDGSFVLDLGGAYKKGKPERSLYNFRVAIKFCDEIGFCMAEDFYWYNPAKLPSPIEWVNKRKVRAKDSVNTVWWFSKTEWPKADITKVLTPYSERMQKLLDNPEKYYQPKKRPSGHDIGNAFSRNNGGAIPSNLLQIPNTESNSNYLRICKTLGIKQHPARFPTRLPEFFIRFLTDPGDLVVDIFAGSNTTGYVAEQERRQWLAIEQDAQYMAASAFRFLDPLIGSSDIRTIYDSLQSGSSLDLDEFAFQARLFEEKGQYDSEHD